MSVIPPLASSLAKVTYAVLLMVACIETRGQFTVAAYMRRIEMAREPESGDHLYNESLAEIGHEIDFDTLIVTKVWNKNFYDRSKTKEVKLDLTEQTTYVAKGKILFGRCIITGISDDVRYEHHEVYSDKKLLQVTQIDPDGPEHTKTTRAWDYKYSPDGKLDSTIVTENGKETARTKNGVEIKKRPPLSVVEKKIDSTTRVIVRIESDTTETRYLLKYKGDRLYQIVARRPLKEKEKNNKFLVLKGGVTTFEEHGLIKSEDWSPHYVVEINYTFDLSGRWVIREKVMDGKIEDITLRTYK